METVNRKIIIISLILSLLTAGLVYYYVSNASAKPVHIEYANVYVAVKTMPAKYKITDSDIKPAKVQKELLNSRAVFNKSDIVGKRLKDSVIEGEQIITDRLADDSKTSLSYNIPAGKRAVSIDVKEQTDVADLIRPGDFVDVIASFEKEETDQGTNKTVYARITKIIIQNIKVLALGQDTNITEDKLKDPSKTVTLALEPKDVEKLVYASEYGVLRLALRAAGDDSSYGSQGTIRDDITTGKGVFTIPAVK
jgi:pilus assembly protein CpaB